MGIFKLKPKQVKKIDQYNTKLEQIEYYVKTSVVTKMLMEKKGQTFDAEFAATMEMPYAFYLVIKRDMTFAPVSELVLRNILGIELDDNIPELASTDKSKKCIDSYIKTLL